MTSVWCRERIDKSVWRYFITQWTLPVPADDGSSKATGSTTTPLSVRTAARLAA
jgi:hypothetical protein